MVSNKLKMIFTQKEIDRLKITEIDEEQIRIVADVHGMRCKQARRFINHIINVIRVNFLLIIIHGYNHGTAIKNMLADNFSNAHIVEQHSDIYNLGVTHMLIAA